MEGESSSCQHSELIVIKGNDTVFYVRGVPGVTGIFVKANSHFDSTQTRSGTAPPH